MEERALLSTLTVTSAADDGPGSLRAAIAAAVSGDTIQFASKLKDQTIHLTSGALAIGRGLTIQGPGSGRLDVDAGGLSRVFSISGADVAISGLTISGGRASDGGGVLVQGGSLTLVGDVVANNTAVSTDPADPARGGGVAVLGGGSLTAVGTTFQGNTAQGSAGDDGNVLSTSVQADNGYTVIRTDSYGLGGDGLGGAIYVDGSGLSLSGGGLLNNRAVGGRGGTGASVAGDGYTSSYRHLGLANNDFGGNGNGGGIYVARGSLTIAGGTFAGNQAAGGSGGQPGGLPAFSDNGRGGIGTGGLVAIASTSTGPSSINGGGFTGNLAVGGAGGLGGGFGGRGQGGAIASAGGSLTVSGATLQGNRAVGGVGGVAPASGGSPYAYYSFGGEARAAASSPRGAR